MEKTIRLEMVENMKADKRLKSVAPCLEDITYCLRELKKLGYSLRDAVENKTLLNDFVYSILRSTEYPTKG